MNERERKKNSYRKSMCEKKEQTWMCTLWNVCKNDIAKDISFEQKKNKNGKKKYRITFHVREIIREYGVNDTQNSRKTKT